MQELPFRPAEEVIEIIHDAGGYDIIPGGYLRNANTISADIGQLAAYGIDGAEGFSVRHTPEIADALRDYARTHQLLITGGGDGHGTYASQEKYAVGIIDIDVDRLNLGNITVNP